MTSNQMNQLNEKFFFFVFVFVFVVHFLIVSGCLLYGIYKVNSNEAKINSWKFYSSSSNRLRQLVHPSALFSNNVHLDESL